MQSDIDKLCAWSAKWQLPFNTNKCKCLNIGKTNPQQHYNMNGFMLDNVKVVKDLGVQMDSELKFHEQTSAAIKKANSILGLIKKTFTNLDEKILPLLYKTMVRPHLEYCNVVWGPHYKLDQQAIEKVQRRATKLVQDIRHLPYNERLKKLKLPSLMYRRRRGDMMVTFNIINHNVNVEKEVFFKFNSSRTRGHQHKLFKEATTKLVRSQSFSRRVVNDWNSLPSDVVAANSVNVFKNKLDEHWENYLFETPF